MSTQPYSVEANVNHYLQPPEGGPPPIYYVGTAGSRRHKYDGRKRQIYNLRGREDEFNLDRNGFQFLKFPVILDDNVYNDEEKVKQILFPEVEQLLKNVTSCTTLHIFSHIVRRASHAAAQQALIGADDMQTVNIQSPAMFAHIDQSYNGAWKVLQAMQHTDASNAWLSEKAKKYRWAIINLWRPLKPITREPLAICDSSTVADSDLQEIKLRVPADYKRNDTDKEPVGYRPVESAIWQLKANERHRWYFPYQMQPDEALLIKCFDSKDDGSTARRAPHSAIQTPMDQGPPRESIEVRVICFWEDEPRDTRARL